MVLLLDSAWTILKQVRKLFAAASESFIITTVIRRTYIVGMPVILNLKLTHLAYRILLSKSSHLISK